MGDVTRLLAAAGRGDGEAFDRVIPLVYEHLRGLARAVRRGPPGTLDTTALVHEAYLKLVPSAHRTWEGRAHFFGVAARAMRQVLADAAERRSAKKRGGEARRVTLDESAVGGRTVGHEELLDLEAALRELEAHSPRLVRVVECRFFAGLSLEETAEAVGVSTATVGRDWRAARAELSRRLRAAR